MQLALQQNTARIAAETQVSAQKIQDNIFVQAHTWQVKLRVALVACTLCQQEADIDFQYTRIHKLLLRMGHDEDLLNGGQLNYYQLKLVGFGLKPFRLRRLKEKYALKRTVLDRSAFGGLKPCMEIKK